MEPLTQPCPVCSDIAEAMSVLKERCRRSSSVTIDAHEMHQAGRPPVAIWIGTARVRCTHCGNSGTVCTETGRHAVLALLCQDVAAVIGALPPELRMKLQAANAEVNAVDVLADVVADMDDVAAECGL